jgi:hypothetical protein
MCSDTKVEKEELRFSHKNEGPDQRDYVIMTQQWAVARSCNILQKAALNVLKCSNSIQVSVTCTVKLECHLQLAKF